MIDREVVQSGAGAMAGAFGDARNAGVRVILPDIVEDADLDAVAAAMAMADLMDVSAGSAGLAESLARMDESAQEPALEVNQTSNVVAIIGTPMEHTQQQVAKAMHALALKRIPLGSDADDLGRVVAAVHAAWAAGHIALVDGVIASAAPSKREQAEQEARVAQFTRALLRASADFGLVVSGGDTARAAFSGIQPEAIELAGEIGWGVPYGAFSSGPAAGYPVVTKAGVMGGPTALADAFRVIARPGSDKG